MFVSKTHLPQILGCETYTSPEILAREIRTMFVPAWHCITVLPDLPEDGSFVTLEFCGFPLIAWRTGDRVQVFRNVCPYRASLISNRAEGRSAGTLRCEAHGCEFDANGRGIRSPHAETGAEPLQLRPVTTELLGPLVFIRLADEGPGLADFFGTLYDEMVPAFTNRHSMFWKTVIHHRANWKIPMENTAESYHTTEVHPNTFGTYPEEQWCVHEFHDGWDMLKVDYSTYQSNRAETLFSRMIGIEPDYTFRHIIHHPNTVISLQKLFNTIWTVIPETPSTCRETIWTFCDASGSKGVRGKLAEKALRWWVKKFSERVRAEDAAIFPCLQDGLASSEHPRFAGMISTREERIFTFQRYVHQHLYPERADEPLRDLPPELREAFALAE